MTQQTIGDVRKIMIENIKKFCRVELGEWVPILETLLGNESYDDCDFDKFLSNVDLTDEVVKEIMDIQWVLNTLSKCVPIEYNLLMTICRVVFKSISSCDDIALEVAQGVDPITIGEAKLITYNKISRYIIDIISFIVPIADLSHLSKEDKDKLDDITMELVNKATPLNHAHIDNITENTIKELSKYVHGTTLRTIIHNRNETLPELLDHMQKDLQVYKDTVDRFLKLTGNITTKHNIIAEVSFKEFWQYIESDSLQTLKANFINSEKSIIENVIDESHPLYNVKEELLEINKVNGYYTFSVLRGEISLAILFNTPVFVSLMDTIMRDVRIDLSFIPDDDVTTKHLYQSQIAKIALCITDVVESLIKTFTMLPTSLTAYIDKYVDVDELYIKEYTKEEIAQRDDGLDAIARHFKNMNESEDELLN